MKPMHFWELLAGLAISALLLALFLPALARSHEAARRSSCQNNLKQMGIVFKMYANESPGRVFPAVSPFPGNWIPDMRQVYPEYLSDPIIFACPSSPFLNSGTFRLQHDFEHPGTRLGEFHPDCVSSLFYVYTGYALGRDEAAQALFDARAVLSPEDFGESSIEVPAEDPAERPLPSPFQLPVLWDRVGVQENDSNHAPKGGNVLYADGHVAFQRYAYYSDPEQFPITFTVASTVNASIPQLSPDCYP